ncbi:hypothetical protein BU24DRAFT_428351 [Aaosphaeria arxii CBS 175.79]|uniref:Uncharacterized protein n=1 Tax=Aaosphaeria arxii CBS 175.79 TaxID=1450172 RepID=A0A6A5X941_9PLEO|nr:uncharacterized protein BU24DRAFT_428351 [Aaosphaeria arxii CBS 175.79]KAF2009443.1 hypothetical protein BU24DRAFT_428351 [Aaosphaeria arxii CBS 175.79]
MNGINTTGVDDAVRLTLEELPYEVHEDDNAFYDDLEDIISIIDDECPANQLCLHADLPYREHSSDEFSDDDNVFDSILESIDLDNGGDCYLIGNTSTPETPAQDVPSMSPSADATTISPKARISQKFISPLIKSSEMPQKQETSQFDRQPIVRPPFPNKARDRSPIVGLSPAHVLRTCFRVGEAIKVGRDAVKNEKDVLIEMYARVASSSRTETKQSFEFRDLFHDKPPHIMGEYHAAIWKSVKLYNVDSARLLKGNKMCRCIGQMKRDMDGYKLLILNIWEVSTSNQFLYHLLSYQSVHGKILNGSRVFCAHRRST